MSQDLMLHNFVILSVRMQMQQHPEVEESHTTVLQ